MPKKFGVNTKKQEALEKKEVKKKQEMEKEIKQIENEYWKETDDKVLKKLQKDKEKEEKRLEKIQKKKENKELVEQEEAELQRQLNKNNNNAQVRVTAKTAIHAKEEELKKLVKKVDQKIESESYQVCNDINPDEEYVNNNFLKMEEYKEYIKNGVDVFEGTGGIDTIIDSLNINSSVTHPERRMKAAWKAYVDKNLPDLKKQYPKYKRSKLLDMLSKDFHKSSDNPMVVFKLQKQRELLKQQLINENKKNDDADDIDEI